jgi:hypothetical protein
VSGMVAGCPGSHESRERLAALIAAITSGRTHLQAEPLSALRNANQGRFRTRL